MRFSSRTGNPELIAITKQDHPIIRVESQGVFWEELNRCALKRLSGCVTSLKVKVEYLGFIKNMLNKRAEELELSEGSTLQNLLSKLSESHGASFRKEVFEPGLKDLKAGFVLTVNGVLIGQLEGVETRLKTGDHVILMSLMSGG